jgi:GT2 family glycosyltransferase
MAYANLDLIGEDGEYLRGTGYFEGYQRPWGSEHIFLPPAPLELNVWANNTIGGAFMYRNRLSVLVGDYSPHRFTAEDYDYWMRMNALGVLRHADFDEPVYDYRFHSGARAARGEEVRMLETRDRLMVFEEFRRDFYLSPMLWMIEHGDASPRAASAITTQVRRLRHLVYDGTYPRDALPRRWTPTVHLKVALAGEAAAPPSAAALAHALKVFVACDTALPAHASPEWDLCCVLGGPDDLPRLAGPGQGWIAAPDASSLVHAIDIRAKSQHLAAIEEEAERPPAPSCTASVVICTYRVGSRTHAAIRSVLEQQCDRPFEVLVVHNAAAAPGRLSIASNGRVPLREIVCPVPGLSAARNAAIAEARGAIVCFLDDDAVADPRWVTRLCDAFEAHPEAGVIGGHIYLHTPDVRPAALRPGWERYWSHFVTGHSGYTHVQHWWEFPWGANWAARRTALLSAGGFRTRYGRVGDNFWGGEELVTASVIQKLGYAVAVLPEASVTHHVDPSRFTYAHARRTLRAAHQVSYAAQRDLFIANQTGFRRTLNDFFTSHYDESIPVEYRHWRNASHRKRAQMRLLLVQLRDVVQRLRKPAVTLDPC